MNPLIASILNNPGKHQVNRDYKMSKTLDVMADNMAKQEAEKAKYLAESTGDAQLDGAHFGYSNKRVQGD